MLKVSTALLTLAEPVFPESGGCPGRKNPGSLFVRQISELRADGGILSSAHSSIMGKENLMEQSINTKRERNTFTKRIGQTTYVVRYHFNEDAKENMQEKINRM